MSDTPPHDASHLKGQRSLQRVVNALRYSWKGFQAAYRHEAAFKDEIALAAIMLPVSVLLPVSFVEHILLVLTALLVILVELLNSAIEAVVDRIGLELHPLSGRAKDLGSAAVMVALVMCGLTWGAILVRWLLTLV